LLLLDVLIGPALHPVYIVPY